MKSLASYLAGGPKSKDDLPPMQGLTSTTSPQAAKATATGGNVASFVPQNAAMAALLAPPRRTVPGPVQQTYERPPQGYQPAKRGAADLPSAMNETAFYDRGGAGRGPPFPAGPANKQRRTEQGAVRTSEVVALDDSDDEPEEKVFGPRPVLGGTGQGVRARAGRDALKRAAGVPLPAEVEHFASEKPFGDTDTVLVADAAWFGSRRCSRCTLTVKDTCLVIKAEFGYEKPIELELVETIVSTIGFSYATGRSLMPPFTQGGLVSIIPNAKFVSNADLGARIDHSSNDKQQRMLLVMVAPNAKVMEISQTVMRITAWKAKWEKMSTWDHDELLVGRRSYFAPVRAAAASAASAAANMFSARTPPPAPRAPRLPRLERSVIYPPGDTDAVTLENIDLRRLAPGEFLNDNLVDFCIKQLRAELSEPEAKRFHFFNSFFFKKLLGEEDDALLPGATHAQRAAAAHKRVARWSGRVDIFSKDYVIIPVNQALHWTLAVITHPGAAAQRLQLKRAMEAAAAGQRGEGTEDDAIRVDSDDDDDVVDVEAVSAAAEAAAAAVAALTPKSPVPSPCILQMDSMGSSHLNVEGVLRDWLACEWAARKGGSIEAALEMFAAGGVVEFVACRTPQQDNSCDCGLFLAECARRFCLRAPPFVSRDPGGGWPYMLTREWFRRTDAGDAKREHIHRSILALAGLVPAPPPQAGGRVTPTETLVIDDD